MFRELFTAAPDAIVVVDHEGSIVRANPQAERMFGYTELELHGQPIEILMPDGVRESHARHRRHYVGNPHVRPMGSGQELIGLKRNGERFPVEIALSPISTPEGRMFLASVRDISETQRVRQALVRARYDSVVARLGRELLKATRIDGALQSVAEIVASLLDAPAAAIVLDSPEPQRAPTGAACGLPIEAVLQMPWKRHLSAARARDGSADGAAEEMVVADADAFAPHNPLHGPTLLMPLSGPEGPIGAMLVFGANGHAFDRDALHVVESAAHSLAAVISRILTEERLSHAQRLEAVGQLTGGVAHDFNNLLTIISGTLQIIEDELHDSVLGREAMRTALRAVSRGSALTRKLLVFARKQRLLPAPVDAARLLGDVGALLRRTLGESIKVEVVHPADLPWVYADAGQLDGALVNLALNARDAMPRGGNLRIAAERRDPPSGGARGGHVMFSVSDTGIGMSPDILDHALEPFFTTKETGKGSGLGLSMVYGFVKQSNGHMEILSKLGYGTCVEMYLPVSDAARRDARGGSADADYVGRGTVLVVEDDPAVRDIAVKFMRSFGHDVLVAESAEGALACVREDPGIVLLFSDVVLGAGMDGVELARQVRRISPITRVLLTSGYEFLAESQHAALAAEYEMLRKPYRREDLASALRRMLQPRPAGARMRATADVPERPLLDS